MRTSEALKLVSRLNGSAFIEYVNCLFTEFYGDKKLPTSFSNFGISSNKKIDPEVFQVHLDDISGPPIGIFNFYNVYLPHPLPLDLLNDTKKINLADPLLKNELKKIRKRYQQYWGDVFTPYGEQLSTSGDVISGIYFLTNFCNLPQKEYSTNIIPKYTKLVQQSGFDDVSVGVGSPDSFFKRDAKTSKRVFEDFMNKYNEGISISLLSKEDFKVGFFNSEKYLCSGVSKNRNFPTEPIYLNQKNRKEEVVQEFENLLSKNPSESELETFLKDNYKEIFGPNYDRIETQLWLRLPELDFKKKNRRIDVFLRNSVSGDWELNELKRPIKLVHSYRDIAVFSKEVSNSIQQLKYYEKLLKREDIRKRFKKDGIEYFEPEVRLVIGRKPQIPLDEWRWLLKTNENGFRITTYDDLIAEMKARIRELK